MPYSKAWRRAMYPDFKDEGAYVDYKATKEILHRMKEDIANPSTPDELYHALLEQKKRVFAWSERKQKELVKMGETLLACTEALRQDNDEGGDRAQPVALRPRWFAPKEDGTMEQLSPPEARLVADAIMYELLRFTETKNLNTDTIEHIVGRVYRYAVLGPTGDRWKNIKTEHDYHSLIEDEVFCLLSKVFDRVKQAEELISGKGQQGISSGAVGSQVFDRRSVKYWVHPQDLPFVIARIIPHLPLSTFKDTYAESKTRQIPFTLYSPVSSVYYDNRKFLFYHRRLERLEGSTLIRMRWYSDTYEKDWNKVTPEDNVFMEIKVHHEAWSGERSNKRRFAVKEKDVDAFVHGDLSLIPALDKLKKKNASEKAQEEFKQLATEIVAKVHAYELKPALRTQCGRAAFQRGADQTVRVSIDTDLRMSAEDFGLDHHWRFTGSDAPVSHFPYAVVEVKLQCAENERIAPWIEELMSCRHMESLPKFSKYAHGIASIYGHTSFINMVPYWMHQLDIDIRASTKPEQSHWDPTVGLASGCLQRTEDRIVFGSEWAAQTQTIGAAEARFMPRSDYARVYQQALRDMQGSSGEKGDAEQEDQENNNGATTEAASTPAKATSEVASDVEGDARTGGAGCPVVQFSVERRHAAFTAFRLYPYSETGVEPLCFNPSKGRNAAAQVFYGSIPWQTGKRIRVPQKYDPKTLLTSERYMVKWVQLATAFGLLGLAAIRFGEALFLPHDIMNKSVVWQGHFHVVIGVTMEVLAVLVLAYAYMAFRARTRRVYARRKIRYDALTAPTLLTFFLVFGFVVLLVINIMRRYGPMITGSDSF